MIVMALIASRWCTPMYQVYITKFVFCTFNRFSKCYKKHSKFPKSAILKCLIICYLALAVIVYDWKYGFIHSVFSLQLKLIKTEWKDSNLQNLMQLGSPIALSCLNTTI